MTPLTGMSIDAWFGALLDLPLHTRQGTGGDLLPCVVMMAWHAFELVVAPRWFALARQWPERTRGARPATECRRDAFHALWRAQTAILLLAVLVRAAAAIRSAL